MDHKFLSPLVYEMGHLFVLVPSARSSPDGTEESRFDRRPCTLELGSPCSPGVQGGELKADFPSLLGGRHLARVGGF